MVVCGRGKLGYLTGDTVEPPITDPKYKLWQAENSIVLANRSRNNDIRDNRRSDRHWCDHCKKSSHTKAVCWVLHGKPDNWTPMRQGDQRDPTGDHRGNNQSGGLQHSSGVGGNSAIT
ncbi:hypothetical protein LIER_33982 [Lithospermum erythrorhizon]|uniref:Uncharacterized protein n=1 Tax=Lithospermum erythrorhizon TaxID=34254 RepID=A0AAV3S1V9_LITER